MLLLQVGEFRTIDTRMIDDTKIGLEIIAAPEREEGKVLKQPDSSDSRKTQYNAFADERKRLFLEMLHETGCIVSAAKGVNVHRSTVYEHMKRDYSFSQAVDETLEISCAPIISKLREMALAGNITAIAMYLYNRSPRQWRRR
jgi:hypothetical protein